MLRDWLQHIPHRQAWYAGFVFLLAIVVLGSLQYLFGGSAEWGSVEGDHYFLGNKFGPPVEVSAFAYWLSVCALWFVRLTAAWLFVVVLAYSVRRRRRS